MSYLYLKLPKSVRVGFFNYNIETIDAELADSKGLYGYADNNKNEIRVSDGLNDQQLLNTVFHEILHAIHWQHGLSDSSTEEEFTNLSTNGLCAFFADNPGFVEWFLSMKNFNKNIEIKEDK